MNDPFLNFLVTRDPKKVKKEAGMVRRSADTARADRLEKKVLALTSELADMRLELVTAEHGFKNALLELKRLRRDLAEGEESRQFLLEENKKLRGSPLRKVA